MKRFRYKILIAISKQCIRVNIFKAYFEKALTHYQLKLAGRSAYYDENLVYNKFCDVNSKYWDEIQHEESAGNFLVEGLFGESGPNYVIRVGMISKALEEVTKAKPVVLLRLGALQEPYKKQIWSSFKMGEEYVGIFYDAYHNFSFRKQTEIKFWAQLYYWWSKILLIFKKNNEFANLSFKNMKIGDILYDDIIKETPVGEHTVNKISKKHKEFFRKMFIYIYASEFIYKKYKPKYYVTTHTQYISYGLPARYFAHHGTLVIETTDDMLFIYDDFSKYPRFHSEINRVIKKNFDKIYNDDKIVDAAKLELNKRFTGKLEQIDVQMAYANKQNYSKEMLKDKLGIKNDNPIVFVFAHIFADTPQGASEKMLFADYYIWLIETIKYIRHIRNINWVIKSHPSSKAYGEEGDVAGLVRKYCKFSDTVFVCPEDFSTAGVLDCAKAIVTVQGTVGLEYSCVGIPIVLAGKPFYADFGFTNEPNTKKEYFNQLKNIQNIKPLTEENMRSAITVYKAFYELCNTDFSLVDTKLKDLTWGCMGEPNILGAFELMSERLKKINPKTRSLYKQIKTRFE